MEFTFETVYDRYACTAMARALRKTVRRKRNLRTRSFGVLIMILAILLSLPSEGEVFTLTGNRIVNAAAVLAIAAVLLFEDQLNGFFAGMRMLAGMRDNHAVFTEDGYMTENSIGKTEWRYDTPTVLAEDARYFILLFEKNHAQVYDKRRMTGGTEADFRTFLCEKTGKEIIAVK